ncbi:MAG: DUF748 domain-containing protein, partial [Burkholderiales bacterium]|nr:DUF748 domain-containing protein [Burkholderiales bacterium]
MIKASALGNVLSDIISHHLIRIEKGKLSLFVKYKIENDQLQAENRVFLDQLTFGDPVESADVVALQVPS